MFMRQGQGQGLHWASLGCGGLRAIDIFIQPFVVFGPGFVLPYVVVGEMIFFLPDVYLVPDACSLYNQ